MNDFLFMRFVLLRRRIFPLVKGGINIILGEVDIEKTNLSKIGEMSSSSNPNANIKKDNYRVGSVG